MLFTWLGAWRASDERLVIGRAGGASVTVRDHRQRTVRPDSYMAPVGSGAPYRWLTEDPGGGARAHSTLIEVTESDPPADVAEALRLPTSGRVLLWRQLLMADDEPVELVASCYPLEIVDGTPMTARRKIRGGTRLSLRNSATRHGSAWTGSPRPASPQPTATPGAPQWGQIPPGSSAPAIAR